MEILDTTFYNNSIKNWIISVAIVIVSFLILRIIKSFIYKRIKKIAQKTSTDLDDLIADIFKQTKIFFLFALSIYFGSLTLTLPQIASIVISKLVVISLLVQGAIWGLGIITYLLERYKKQRFQDDAAGLTTFSALGFVTRLVLWTFILLLILDNLGINITTLVAGLGIGGIAVALALQNILGDLFASLSIVLDKPFVLGDFIIVDNYLGTIEYIGLKTTRLRSLSGEQLVFSNNDLLKSRIRNFKRMYERRVVFSIGVTYQTTHDKLAKIPKMIRGIVEAQDPIRFDRSHFKEFGNFSLNYETVYWVKSPDYNKYMDIQQNINLALYKKFEEEEIEFAYPTQTLFVSNEGEHASFEEDQSA